MATTVVATKPKEVTRRRDILSESAFSLRKHRIYYKSTHSLKLLAHLAVHPSAGRTPAHINKLRNQLQEWHQREQLDNFLVGDKPENICNLDFVFNKTSTLVKPVFDALDVLTEHLLELQKILFSKGRAVGVQSQSPLSSTVAVPDLTSQPPKSVVQESWHMVEYILERIQNMSDVSRDLALKELYPGASECGGELLDALVRKIYPYARRLVSQDFPLVQSSLQDRMAVSISLHIKPLLNASKSHKKYSDGEYRISWPLDGISPTPSGRRMQDSFQHLRPHSDPPHALPVKMQLPCSSEVGGTDHGELYFCAFVDCEQPPLLFDSKSSLSRHMATAHPFSQCWVCESAQHLSSPQTFSSAIAFQGHMWEEHKGTFSASDLGRLTEWCKREACQIDTCLLCLEPLAKQETLESEHEDAVLNHLAQHSKVLSDNCRELLPQLNWVLQRPDPL